MATVTEPQDIPAQWLELYRAALVEVLADSGIRRRYPFKMPHMSNKGKNVTVAQLIQREVFCDCVRCFNVQPESGGVTPPDIGPRNRSWWYSQNGGLWYYDYFMQQTINGYLSDGMTDWCKGPIGAAIMVDAESPDTNYKWQSRVRIYNNGNPAQERRTYINHAQDGFQKAMLYLKTIDAGGTGKYQLNIKVHKIEEAWDAATITWNNQPALGPVVFQGLVRYPPGGYRGFRLGAAGYNFCITAVQGQSDGWRLVSSYAGVPYVERAYMAT